ncbi:MULTISPECIES: ABC transporter substrate-binding protein [unclassified Microbacterium]|uniref:ABC transporter substrate-binding protein n=1 Tax=unclassified Microbacterium TaxID=2609290 RepID=UPI00214C75C2|nr:MULTISPECIES: ABC transporter substrate-binding protein [unclassified Microbacterium]MCR2783256.1 ABC transporter substrate-binding protein [Microbacterium sp. zg.B96]WIM15869.1 ABC transporter substrate-binding protein [Microbacterium sp. zg-B96]
MTAVAAMAVAGLMLTACAGSGSLSGETEEPGGGGEGTEELTPVTVGLIPIAASAAVQMGIDAGVFEEQGLDVSVQIGQGGAALLPAVSNGDIEFAVGNPLSVLVAASQGLEMSIIAGFSSVDVPADMLPTGVIVKEDSGITTWKDLEGKKVAVNAFNTQGDLAIMESVALDGGDPAAVEFTELAFPDQLPQLEQGNIDAAWMPDPFFGAGAATEGMTVLGEPMGNAIPGLASMVTFTSTAYAEENPEIVEKFRAGIAESLEMAMADTDGYREVVVTFTGMDAEVVENINFEHLSADLDESIIEDLSALALKYEFLEQEPDLEQVLLLN